ncbi:melanocortin-2 receptor accessory protein 2-like isoform X2 [Pristis pectinata]|uniref:melanocortin-2 receptor accessory protein 2-like isoform X2 n=1 Tax=Pristis pectinata TaxID=685728 RepID=UPI00223DE3A9|nr:melanocortin-2 receptor accessory protein 2-like isoform X2 [Pristis pectinata]
MIDRRRHVADIGNLNEEQKNAGNPHQVPSSAARNRCWGPNFSQFIELNWMKPPKARCEMSEDNPAANKTTVSNSDYIWGYEYYDYEPVSFEGLKAHRYSIVIGFWVGLAVFVLFMFFVLTLLTKTGAPHQENLGLATKQQRVNSFAINYVTCKTDKAFCHPASEESRSLFHFYENEVGHLERQLMVKASDPGSSDVPTQEGGGRSNSIDDAVDCLGKFDIPNCVSLDQSSSLMEDDLLMCEQPVIFENKQDRLQVVHQMSD